MRNVPLNITLNEALKNYTEAAVEMLAKNLSLYVGETVEISLYEYEMESGFLEAFSRLDRYLKEASPHAVDRKLTYEIRTTGSGMSEELAMDFQSRGVTVCLLADCCETMGDAAAILTRCGVDFYIGTAVTKRIAAHIDTWFAFLVENGWNSQAYWPVICEAERENVDEQLSSVEYARFLERLFGLWKERRTGGNPVYIREFENFAGSIKGYETLVSSMSGRCPFQNVIFPDGTIYPRGCQAGKREYQCRVTKKQNIQTMERIEVAEKCRLCRWVSLCQSDRMCRMNPTAFCETYQQFYQLALPKMLGLLRELGR